MLRYIVVNLFFMSHLGMFVEVPSRWVIYILYFPSILIVYCIFSRNSLASMRKWPLYEKYCRILARWSITAKMHRAGDTGYENFSTDATLRFPQPSFLPLPSVSVFYFPFYFAPFIKYSGNAGKKCILSCAARHYRG